MSRTLRARFGAGLLGLALLLPLAAAAPAGAAAADFPAGMTGYHTYAEMVADIDATVAAHPTIVQKLAIGTSYKGRTI
jgi:carboxypeptidase T